MTPSAWPGLARAGRESSAADVTASSHTAPTTPHAWVLMQSIHYNVPLFTSARQAPSCGGVGEVEPVGRDRASKAKDFAS